MPAASLSLRNNQPRVVVTLGDEVQALSFREAREFAGEIMAIAQTRSGSCRSPCRRRRPADSSEAPSTSGRTRTMASP